MVMANTERISKALDLLRDGLRTKCEETWQGFYGDDWLQTVNQRLHNPQREPSTDDAAFLLTGKFYVLFAVTPNLVWAALALFVATMSSNVLWVFSSTLLQISVEDAYRGRVFAADFMLFTIIMTAATLATAWGLDYAALTPRLLAVISGGLLVLSGLFWIARPQQHVTM